MKKAVALICIMAILSFTGTSYADSALKKLGRGVANVFTCPIEVLYRIGEANEESGPIAAATWGVLNGFWRMGTRGVVGLYEVLTFPIPLPGGYAPIIDDPEFMLEEGIF